MENPNPILQWIESDKDLLQFLQQIDQDGQTEEERAEIAFHRLAERYNLPKYPDDVASRETIMKGDWHLYDPLSLYETLGQAKFGDKENDIKGNVLMAAYIMINGLCAIIDEEVDEYIGEGMLLGYGYKGENSQVEMIPIKKGESWAEKGCTYFVKEV